MTSCSEMASMLQEPTPGQAKIFSAKKPPAEMTMADFGDTKTQTVSTLNKIKGILASRGYAMSDIIKMTVFVNADPKRTDGKMDFAGMNEGFRQFFGTAENPNTVARSTVQVAGLPRGVLVEIDALVKYGPHATGQPGLLGFGDPIDHIVSHVEPTSPPRRPNDDGVALVASDVDEIGTF